ncbi:hypothetical protein DSLASN_14990 [Desulfoluna limicola]|uniref:Secreted protein n=1 Tax=Desulfoluna limicola TaxID=2810562 RepID=A0ABM7PEZ3_9BACT|nr:hypothetical protein [Desulfoluna limicola]BCS95867.1 hypothetical protein DSLASN_14990 [Desulfoluna limicola]
MKKIILAFVCSIFLYPNNSFAEQVANFIGKTISIVDIENVDREAEAWARCSCVYSLVSNLVTSKSAISKQYKNLSNGAKLAIVMAHVTGGLQNEDITPEEFEALWNYSITLMDSISEAQMTQILAETEATEDKTFIQKKLLNSLKICQDNLSTQQEYIDLYRSLAKSGLLKLK